MIGKAPDALRKRNLIGANNALDLNMGVYDTGDGDMVSPSYQGFGQQAFSSPQETFGVTAIRELVSLLPGLMPKPPEPPEPGFSDLVSAIAQARGAGDTALEEQLREVMNKKIAASPVLTAPPSPLPKLPEMIAADNADETAGAAA